MNYTTLQKIAASSIVAMALLYTNVPVFAAERQQLIPLGPSQSLRDTWSNYRDSYSQNSSTTDNAPENLNPRTKKQNTKADKELTASTSTDTEATSTSTTTPTTTEANQTPPPAQTSVQPPADTAQNKTPPITPTTITPATGTVVQNTAQIQPADTNTVASGYDPYSPPIHFSLVQDAYLLALALILAMAGLLLSQQGNLQNLYTPNTGFGTNPRTARRVQA